MKCERCNKNEATITYTETVMGNSTKYNLCAECAAKMNPGAALSSVFGTGVSLLESLIGNMFGSNLKLSADMVFYKPFYKGIAFIVYCIVKSDSASDKHFFDLGNL